MEPYDVFLSYAGADLDLASWLHARLETSGLRVFFDKYDLVPGAAVGSGLAEAVRCSKYFVPLVTQNLGERQWPRFEIESALAHAPFGKVIPVLHGVARHEIPDVLRPFSPLILARDGDGTGDSVDVLIAVLRGDDVPAVRRRLSEPRPDPRYPDAGTREAGGRLRELYRERALQEAAGQDTRPITAQLLALRREMRNGPQLRAGDQLGEGRFELIEIAGTGGFATVWKAYDARDQRVVALKLLHGQHVRDASVVDRFFRGARTMAELRHPGIVTVVEAKGEEDGYLYFVMEYLPGGDFGRAIADGRLAGVEALRVLLVVGEALAFAHASGFVHRDVKPDNILLDRVGGPRLTDFDLVRGLATTGGTRAGAGLGTFLYAAPEARIDAAEAGPAADVYSLGVTALFVLCGGDLPARAIGRPEEVLDGLTGGSALRRAIARAVAFEPAQRFASVPQFCDALRETLDAGERITGPPTGVPTPAAPVVLEARDLRVQFGPRVLVRDLSLAILRGEVVGLLGSSGSGSAVLLRLLAGRLHPSGGEIRVCGRPIEAAQVGFVAEDDVFVPELTVAELVRHRIVMHSDGAAASADLDALVLAALESVGLDAGVRPRRPDELSRGMRRRLAIALELVRRPEVLCLEDVTAGLDPGQARAIVLLCRALSSRGLTIVMPLPALSDAEFHLFDRVVVVGRSLLLWSGPTHEAIGWFERERGTAAPLARTAIDFLHEASSGGEAAGGNSFLTAPEYERHVAEPLRRAVAAPSPSRSPVGTAVRLRALTRVYARQIGRRRAYVLVRLLQAVVIGAAVGALPFDLLAAVGRLITNGMVGGRSLDFPPLDAGSGLAVVLSTVAFWCGASGAVFEVLRERAAFVEARATGVSTRLSLAAKLPVQGGLALAQIVLFGAAFVATRGALGDVDTGVDYLWSIIQERPVVVLGILWCTALVATVLGLLVSGILATRPPGRRGIPAGWLFVVALLAIWVLLLATRSLLSLLELAAGPPWEGLANVAIMIALGVAGIESAVSSLRRRRRRTR